MTAANCMGLQAWYDCRTYAYVERMESIWLLYVLCSMRRRGLKPACVGGMVGPTKHTDPPRAGDSRPITVRRENSEGAIHSAVEDLKGLLVTQKVSAQVTVD